MLACKPYVLYDMVVEASPIVDQMMLLTRVLSIPIVGPNDA